MSYKLRFDYYDWEIIYKDVIDKDICFIKCDQSLRSMYKMLHYLKSGFHYLYDDDEFPSKYKKYVNQSFQFCKSKILVKSKLIITNRDLKYVNISKGKNKGNVI